MKTHFLKAWVFIFIFAIGIVSVGAKSAQAQRATEIYGYAYEGSGGPLDFWGYGYWPYCNIAVWDDYGHHWSAFSSPSWYLMGLRSNRWYNVQARVWSSLYSPTSRVYRVWAPQKAWYQVNSTSCPTIQFY